MGLVARRIFSLVCVLIAATLTAGAFELKPTLPPITDKTLVVWCTLDDLEQRGGSVLTLEQDDRFDGLVLGEVAPRTWMAGSDNLARTPHDQSAVKRESASRNEFVQVAAVYQGATVTLYRNGQVLHQYTIDKPATFTSGSLILIGLRHKAARDWDNAHFDGRVEEARLYDVPLSVEQLASLRPNVSSEVPPLGLWTFEDGSTRDAMGNFPEGKLFGGARIKDGVLLLDGRNDHMATPTSVDFSDGLRFAPEGTIFGDAIPFYWDGVYHVFYLRGPGWGHIASRDLVHWEERPHALAPASNRTAPDGQDCWTGSIVHHEGTFHLFYTGKNSNDPLGDQKVMHATSTDLDSWTKHPEHTFYADGEYYWSMPINGNEEGKLNAHHTAFRDPEVFWNEGAQEWWMLLHAALPDGSLGAFSCHTSGNLIQWKPREPLYTYPLSVSGDCPNIFRMDGRWYIIAADYHYTLADAPGGPYREPMLPYDCGDLRVPKTMFDGTRRILVGWIRDRAGYSDAGAGGWGGIMSMPRVLYADSEGRLCQRPPREVIESFSRLVPDIPQTLASGETLDTPPSYMLKADLHATGLAEIRFRQTEGMPDSGYTISIDPNTGEISISNGHETYQRVVPLTPGRPIPLQLFVVGTAAECFVDNQHAFTLRIFDHKEGTLSLHAGSGEASLEGISLSTQE
jgi:sucrose-6-phosphate hydrolase SacC (GH32 family)